MKDVQNLPPGRRNRRRVHIRSNLLLHFSGVSVQKRQVRHRVTAFHNLSAEEILSVIRLILRHETDLMEIMTYVRDHRRAAGELELEDVEFVRDLLMVRDVLES